ncbi:MAG TPA: DsrH/TusB family sulfur metabolism protein [Pseudomonadales bacterium]|nr:DsrH/TusB family sulfur metabolism protein [Pseudomonadales bacterium]
MTCLHMVSSLPGSPSFERAVASVCDDDTLLLCGDATYASHVSCQGNIFCMAEDATARGVLSPYMAADYQTLVALVCQHDKQIDWG